MKALITSYYISHCVLSGIYAPGQDRWRMIAESRKLIIREGKVINIGPGKKYIAKNAAGS